MQLKQLFAVSTLLCTTGLISAQACYESSILSPNPFMGNDGEIFKLADGSLWEVKYEYEYLYEYNPSVLICPSRGKLAIKGKMLNVQHVGGGKNKSKSHSQEPSSSDVIESQIEGEFSGWSGETIFKLTNGQIWQQATYAYTYTYKYRPNVQIIKIGSGYEMQVEDMNSKIRVTRLK